MSTAANAARISYNFSGTGAGPQTAGFNAADGSYSIAGVFSFDDSLFSGAGVFRLPPPNDNADRIDQEYPQASVSFDRTTSFGTAHVESENLVRVTARPDLRYVDWDSTASGVTFFYDNLVGLGGFINLSFADIALLDDPNDLIGLSGEALYRASGQIGTNVYQLYNIRVDGISAVPLPAAIWLFGAALAGLAGFGMRRQAAG